MSESPRILVDADACPVKQDVARLAARRGMPVTFVGNSSQGAFAPAGVELVTVGDAPDAADFEIVTRARPGDIVVTDDIGLASMALPKGARCVSSRGKVYDEHNIGFLMAGRHIGQQIRAAGGRTKGPKAFKSKDREHFRRIFAGLIQAAQRAESPPPDPTNPPT